MAPCKTSHLPGSRTFVANVVRTVPQREDKAQRKKAHDIRRRIFGSVATSKVFSRTFQSYNFVVGINSTFSDYSFPKCAQTGTSLSNGLIVLLGHQRKHESAVFVFLVHCYTSTKHTHTHARTLARTHTRAFAHTYKGVNKTRT